MAITEITADIFYDRMKTEMDLSILDVRTNIECRTESLDYPYIHVPLHLLHANSFVERYGKRLAGKPLYILCRSGGRARKAAESLSAAGLDNVVIVTGGMGACVSCGTPVRKGKTLSLERQVRIAAGTLVLAGVLLGHFAYDAFFILSGFVGAGLVFAGVTDRCGMALLLARAPWNTDNSRHEIEKSIQAFNRKGA